MALDMTGAYRTDTTKVILGVTGLLLVHVLADDSGSIKTSSDKMKGRRRRKRRESSKMNGRMSWTVGSEGTRRSQLLAEAKSHRALQLK